MRKVDTNKALTGYITAFVASVGIVIARYLLTPWLEDDGSLQLLIWPVLVSFWFGLFPGLFATLICSLAGMYFFLEPINSFYVARDVDQFRLFIFSLTGVAISMAGMVKVRATTRAIERELSLQEEIKRRETVEELAREEHERLRVTMSSIGDAVITTDIYGRVDSMNPIAETFTGWPGIQANGLPIDKIFNILNKQTRERVDSPVKRVLAEGKIAEVATHTILKSRDGTERPIDNSAAPIIDDKRGLIGVVLIFRDVTERARLEKEQRETTALKTAMINSSLDAIITMDHEGKVVEFNKAAENIFGYNRDDVVGKEMANLIVPPSLRESHRLGLARFLESGKAQVLNRRIELVGMHSDTTEFPVELTITRIEPSEPPLFTGYIRDITDRKEAERALRASEEKFRNLADNIPQLAWMTDARGKRFWFNKRWFDYTGTTLEQMEGEGWKSVHHPDHLERVVNKLQYSFDTGEPWEDTFPLLGKDGIYRWFLSRAQPIHNTNGEILRWFGTNTDVTAQREMEEELRQLARQLSEEDRRKDEFLATLSHELRNPLSPLRNSLEIMKRSPQDSVLTEEARSVMDRQLLYVERLIDDLLDISRITNNKLELRIQTVLLASVINHAIETNKPLAARQRHSIITLLPEAPIYIKGDFVRLAQVFANLLNNACKYTPPNGQITLNVTINGAKVLISVKDNGIGMSSEILPLIFNPFMQKQGHYKAQGGLGIGLALVKRLVELHQGWVEAFSDGEGKGSEFIVHLPFKKELFLDEKSSLICQADEPALQYRILVTDDQVDNTKSLAALLKVLGHSVELAYDGLQAIASAEVYHPDIIFLDIGMPNLDGYETCRQIRELPWGRESVIVALTGWGQEEDRRKTYAAGFNYHLVKPIKMTDLTEIIASLRSYE